MQLLLNNKPIVYYISYDIDGGWVEVIDTKLVAEQHKNAEVSDANKNTVEESELPTKKLYGKITFNNR